MIRRLQLCPALPHYGHYITLPGVIKNIKMSSDVAMIKIRHDKRHIHQCPFCRQKMGENRRLWQVVPGTLQEIRITTKYSQRTALLHILRRTALTVRVLQEFMDHADVNTTDIYTHVMKRDIAGIQKPMGKLGE